MKKDLYTRTYARHFQAIRDAARAQRNDPERAAKDARTAAIVASVVDLVPIQIGSKGQLLTKKASDS